MKEGLLDWDCAEAIDIPAMADALSYIRQHASFPVTHNLPPLFYTTASYLGTHH